MSRYSSLNPLLVRRWRMLNRRRAPRAAVRSGGFTGGVLGRMYAHGAPVPPHRNCGDGSRSMAEGRRSTTHRLRRTQRGETLGFVGKLLRSQADPGSHRRKGTRYRTAHSRNEEDRTSHAPWFGCTVPKGRKLIAHGVSRGLRPTIARSPGGAAEIFRPFGAGRVRRPVTPGLRPGLLTFAPSGLSPSAGCHVRVGVVPGSGKQPLVFRRSLPIEVRRGKERGQRACLDDRPPRA